MTKVPWRWQAAAAAWGAAREIMAIVADCGVGKSFAAILIALAKRRPVIIIAPGHRLCDQWSKDIKRDAGPEEDVWVYDRNEETREGDRYRERFLKWLTT
jgi:superfamily II DNA or RNA helicase